ncbi:Uncharacterised protein [Mycobacteroides abscessus subsp. abscessus]|nr:Uncharacterised protein [Mycobacteroides abscessus subsp. abscessus]
MTALDRAFPLSDSPDRAVLVCEHLHLDVMSPFDIRLTEDCRITERRRRFAFGGGNLLGQLVDRPYDPHTASTAARRRLDQQWQVALGDGGRVDVAEDRHAGVGHQLLGVDL